MSDYYHEAVRTWQQADKNLKLFSECCAFVSNKYTASLADDCGVSVDTIERYRNMYKMYRWLDTHIESERVRKLWEGASVAIWRKCAEFWIRYDLNPDTVLEYLQTGKDSNMTRESFSAHVEEMHNKLPGWLRHLKKAVSYLRKLSGDFKSELPPEFQDEFDELSDRFADLLERAAKVEA